MTIIKQVTKNTKSWRWRITKAGYKGSAFASLVGMKPDQLNGYLTGKRTPSMVTHDKIESKLRSLGV